MRVKPRSVTTNVRIVLWFDLNPVQPVGEMRVFIRSQRVRRHRRNRSSMMGHGR